MMHTPSVIVAGARTPVGRLLGSLRGFSGSDLGGLAIEGALHRAGITPDQVDYVIMGQVLTAGAGQIPARQAAVAAGIPMDVPALTVNKVCLSGINAITLADQMIRAGAAEIVVAGGQESMSQAPHLLERSRQGFKYGDTTLRDHMAYDGLHDIFTDQAMGQLTEAANHGPLAVSRHDQDSFAAESHQRAARAWKDGIFDNEVVPVSIPQRDRDPEQFTVDEGVRPGTTADSLAALPPAFSATGTLTAGTSSQISDGAAAVVVMSKTYWALASQLLTRRESAVGLAVINSIAAIGGFLGPYVIGKNASASDVTVGLYFPAACLIVAATMIAFMRTTRTRALVESADTASVAAAAPAPATQRSR